MVTFCHPMYLLSVSFQPVHHDWCNKGCGIYYPDCGMVHIKEPLLLIGKNSPCGGSGFPLSLSEWSFLVRNGNDIKGITIDGIEYLIYQYADDTSFMLDGSPKSLNNTLLIFEYYVYIISGLKLNYAKTNVIWIGSKMFSKDVFHHTCWKLQWGTTQFNLLGIIFSVNLENIVELNYKTKLLDMKKSIKLWSIKTITALGRITVLKTIIIPKLTYLFIFLPNPSNKLLKIINDALFKFIWQNKPDKLKRDLITQEYQDGGIKMINITNFIAALIKEHG